MGDRLAIKPSLEDIQTIIKKAIIIIQTSMKAVTKWSKRGRRKTLLNDVKESETDNTVNPSINVKDYEEENAEDRNNMDRKFTKDTTVANTLSVTSEIESQNSQV